MLMAPCFNLCPILRYEDSPYMHNTTRTLLLVPKQVTQTEPPAFSPSRMALLAAPLLAPRNELSSTQLPVSAKGTRSSGRAGLTGYWQHRGLIFVWVFCWFCFGFFCFVLWVEILLHSPGWPGTHNTAQAVLKFTILLPLTSRCWCSEHVSPRQLVLDLVVWFFHKAFYIGVCWMETLLEKPAHSSQARIQRKNNVRRKKSRKFLSFKKRAHFRHAQKRPERHASRCSSALCTEPWDACK